MDEVHERDINIDFTLVLLKYILSKILKKEEFKDGCKLNFKLILMSATINEKLFANYFSLETIKSIE